jgi:N-acetylneuraminic acid mutarotase
MRSPKKALFLGVWSLYCLQILTTPARYCVKNLAPIRGAPRQEHSVVSAGNNVYILAGLRGPGETLTAAVEVYHPANDSWTDAPPLPFAAHHVNVAAVDGALYYLGGLFSARGSIFQSVVRPDAYRLEPAGAAPGRWAALAPMPDARGSAAVGVHGRTVWLAGGLTARMRSLDAVSSYDTALDRWTTHGALRLPEARGHAGGAVVDGVFYVVGGRVASHAQNRATVYALNLTALASGAQTSWVAKAPMPVPRGGLAVAAAGEKIYTFGGEGNRASSKGVFSDVAVYDIATDSWETAVPMMAPRHGFGAAFVGDKVYVPGGGARQGGGEALAVNEVYWQC